MARNKVPLPDTAAEWLAGYLDRRGIDATRYPNDLNTLEWQRLKTAYRQHTLQASRIEAVGQQSDVELLAANERLQAENDSLQMALHECKKTIKRLNADIDVINRYKELVKPKALQPVTNDNKPPKFITSNISIADEIAPTYGKELSDKVRSLKIKKAVSALGIDLEGKTIKYASDDVKIQVIEWIKANKP